MKETDLDEAFQLKRKIGWFIAKIEHLEFELKDHVLTDEEKAYGFTREDFVAITKAKIELYTSFKEDTHQALIELLNS